MAFSLLLDQGFRIQHKGALDALETIDLLKGLNAVNARSDVAGADSHSILVRTAQDHLAAGITADFWPGAVVDIRLLWVMGRLRNQGLGRRLVEEIENQARERGIFRAQVDTLSVQAPGFYPKLGYACFGRLDCGRFERLYFSKSLEAAPGA